MFWATLKDPRPCRHCGRALIAGSRVLYDPSCECVYCCLGCYESEQTPH